MTTSLKTCFKCGLILPLTEYYKHSEMKDGHLNKCKECSKKDVKKNRAKNIHYYRKYDRERGSRMTSKDLKAQRAKYPDKNRARARVNVAISRGKITKQPCVICGSKNVHAHHEDYSKPLDVVWLCPRHHAAIHAQPN